MIEIDTKRLVSKLRTVESIALLSSVTSTNLLARLITAECAENETNLPTSILIAEEQRGGRGRAERTWHSPLGKGIYTTILHSRPESEVGYLPFEIAVIVADFLSDVYRLSPQLKWPNDVLVDGKKIAGILIEGRSHKGNIYLSIGVGINVETMSDAPEEAIAIADVSSLDAVDVISATEAFIEFIDERLADPRDPESILEAWIVRSIHEKGDPIEFVVGNETITGTWAGIDQAGQALLDRGSERIAFSAGDLILSHNSEEDEPEDGPN